MSTATVPAPPAAALALDAHWAAKMDRLRARSLPQVTLRICDDDQAKEAFLDAKAKAARTRSFADADPKDKALAAELKQAEKALEAARTAYDDASIVLTFRALPRPALEALFKAHPPTEEQEADGSEWNVDTFPPALITAASVDGMTEQDAQSLLDTWSSADAGALFNAAMEAQQQQRTDLGKG